MTVPPAEEIDATHVEVLRPLPGGPPRCWNPRPIPVDLTSSADERGGGMTMWTTASRIRAAGVDLDGDLTLPAHAGGMVLFAHGSGSSRHSPRNRAVAEALNQRGLATLLVDLLTADEDQIDARTRHLRFDIGLLA